MLAQVQTPSSTSLSLVVGKSFLVLVLLVLAVRLVIGTSIRPMLVSMGPRQLCGQQFVQI
jgi:hypothetical protein